METSVAKANPTRRFFVDILTRDISLQWAILDLVDNAIDSFRESDRAMDACHITITLSADEFIIEDDAAGIPRKKLEEYAFSFGRKQDATSVSGAIGLYGVGMKRAIFKLGRHFELVTTTSHSKCSMDVDVNKWLTDQDPEWTFPLDIVSEADQKTTGTRLRISQLTDTTRAEFKSIVFLNGLRETASKIYCYLIENGLSITIEGIKLESTLPKLSFSDKLQPKVVLKDVDGIHFKLIAGVFAEEDEQKLDSSEAGWTVLCNDRAVLIADKSELTGWGESDDFRNPKYHNQYIRFRGIVWISADDSLKLPWNTTKSSLDTDNAFYQAVAFPEMKNALRAVADYLNKIKEESVAMEQAEEPEESSLAITLHAAKSTTDFTAFTASQSFHYEIPASTTPKIRYTNVQFRRRKTLVDAAVGHYGSASASEFGGSLFDDYVKEYELDE